MALPQRVSQFPRLLVQKPAHVRAPTDISPKASTAKRKDKQLPPCRTAGALSGLTCAPFLTAVPPGAVSPSTSPPRLVAIALPSY